jgi:hypothetical protein
VQGKVEDDQGEGKMEGRKAACTEHISEPGLGEALRTLDAHVSPAPGAEAAAAVRERVREGSRRAAAAVMEGGRGGRSRTSSRTGSRTSSRSQGSTSQEAQG